MDFRWLLSLLLIGSTAASSLTMPGSVAIAKAATEANAEVEQSPEQLGGKESLSAGDCDALFAATARWQTAQGVIAVQLFCPAAAQTALAGHLCRGPPGRC